MRRTLSQTLRSSLRPLGLAVSALCILAVCALGMGRWFDAGEPLLQHDGGEYRFQYPARWELTHDTFDVATPDSRVVALRAPDGPVLMVHSFVPASHLSAEEFADELARKRREVIAELGGQGGEIQRQVPERMRIAGALRDGVRQEFDLATGGVHSAQVALFFRMELGEQELFFSIQSPAHRAARAEDEFAQVLASLQVEVPPAASALSTDVASAPGARPLP